MYRTQKTYAGRSQKIYLGFCQPINPRTISPLMDEGLSQPGDELVDDRMVKHSRGLSINHA